MRILCEETTFLEEGCPDQEENKWLGRDPDQSKNPRRRDPQDDGDFTEMVDPYTKSKRVSDYNSLEWWIPK